MSDHFCLSDTQFIRAILREWMDHEMSDISEEHYCAGWMSDLEYALWNAIQRLPAETNYGMGALDVERLTKLKAVSDILGEWFDGDDYISLAEWQIRFDSKPNKRSRPCA